MRLENKTAVISGAARGIGFATAHEFLKQGGRVSLLDINPSQAQSNLNTLGDLAERGRVFEVDVSDQSSVMHAVEQAQLAFGPTQILVNCAAAQTPAATVEDLPLEEWNKAFAINVTGSFLMAKAVLPGMRTAGGGSIIHIASQLGRVGTEGFSAYCATKGAIRQLAKTMALDHARHNIRVNSLSPGAVLTQRLRDRFQTDQGATDALGPKHPIGRLGTAEDIAMAAVYLASDESSFMTGSDLLIDGGYAAQ